MSIVEEDRDGSNPEPPADRAAATRQRTPLPKLQLGIVLLCQFAEPLTAMVVYPFVNKLVRETGITGGDETKTGYYAGIIVIVHSSLARTCLTDTRT